MPKGIVTISWRHFQEMQDHIAELTEQRDALLAACKAARLYGNQGETPDGRSVDTMLRAAIAKATGAPNA